MCTCASCIHTDAFSGRADLFSDGSPTIKGFDNWPRGESAGKRASDADYRAHVKHLWDGVYKGQPPKFSLSGLVMPIAPAPKAVHDWINRNGPQFERVKKASPAKAEPARPAQACKPEQHFPAQDRPRETAVIYAMPKSLKEKRPRGRPAIQGRRVVIKLEDEQIKRAEKLGGGNVAAGIRKALSR